MNHITLSASYAELVKDETLALVYFKPSAELRKKYRSQMDEYEHMKIIWGHDTRGVRTFYNRLLALSAYFSNGHFINPDDILIAWASEIRHLRQAIKETDKQQWMGLTWETLQSRACSHLKFRQLIEAIQSDAAAFKNSILSLDFHYQLHDAPGFGTPIHLLVLYYLSCDNVETIEEKASSLILGLFRDILNTWGKKNFISLLIRAHENAIIDKRSDRYRPCILSIFIEHCENRRVHFNTIDTIRLAIKSMTGVQFTFDSRLSLFKSPRQHYLSNKLKQLKLAEAPLQKKFEQNLMLRKSL